MGAPEVFYAGSRQRVVEKAGPVSVYRPNESGELVLVEVVDISTAQKVDQKFCRRKVIRDECDEVAE